MNIWKEMNEFLTNDTKSIKKVSAVLGTLLLLFLLTSCGNPKYVGTWYNTSDPDGEQLIITKDDTFSWKGYGGSVSETDDGILLTETSGLAGTETIQISSYDGDTTLIVENGDTYVNSYDKAVSIYEENADNVEKILVAELEGVWRPDKSSFYANFEIEIWSDLGYMLKDLKIGPYESGTLGYEYDNVLGFDRIKLIPNIEKNIFERNETIDGAYMALEDDEYIIKCMRTTFHKVDIEAEKEAANEKNNSLKTEGLAGTYHGGHSGDDLTLNEDGTYYFKPHQCFYAGKGYDDEGNENCWQKGTWTTREDDKLYIELKPTETSVGLQNDFNYYIENFSTSPDYEGLKDGALYKNPYFDYNNEGAVCIFMEAGYGLNSKMEKK